MHPRAAVSKENSGGREAGSSKWTPRRQASASTQRSKPEDTTEQRDQASSNCTDHEHELGPFVRLERAGPAASEVLVCDRRALRAVGTRVQLVAHRRVNTAWRTTHNNHVVESESHEGQESRSMTRCEGRHCTCRQRGRRWSDARAGGHVGARSRSSVLVLYSAKVNHASVAVVRRQIGQRRHVLGSSSQPSATRGRHLPSIHSANCIRRHNGPEWQPIADQDRCRRSGTPRTGPP